MNERITKHVEGLFENAPRTRRSIELRDEMIANLNDRYNDLIAEGKDAETAYSTVIAGIGDISELIQTLRDQEVFDPILMQMQRQKSALLISVAVALYIISCMPFFVLGMLWDSEASHVIGAAIAILICAIATMLLVYNGVSKPKYEKMEDTIVEEFKEFTSDKRKKDALRKSLYSIVPILTVFIYLALGFSFHWWHPGWMIFLLIPVFTQIIRLWGIYRGDD